jgi:hypothetical protein
MKKYISKFKEEIKFKTIKIIARDCNNNLESLLNFLKDIGNSGHSFSIIVDPEGPSKKFYWDGDGTDYIKEINIEKEI